MCVCLTKCYHRINMIYLRILNMVSNLRTQNANDTAILRQFNEPVEGKLKLVVIFRLSNNWEKWYVINNFVKKKIPDGWGNKNEISWVTSRRSHIFRSCYLCIVSFLLLSKIETRDSCSQNVDRTYVNRGRCSTFILRGFSQFIFVFFVFFFCLILSYSLRLMLLWHYFMAFLQF